MEGALVGDGCIFADDAALEQHIRALPASKDRRGKFSTLEDKALIDFLSANKGCDSLEEVGVAMAVAVAKQSAVSASNVLPPRQYHAVWIRIEAIARSMFNRLPAAARATLKSPLDYGAGTDHETQWAAHKGAFSEPYLQSYLAFKGLNNLVRLQDTAERTGPLPLRSRNSCPRSSARRAAEDAKANAAAAPSTSSGADVTEAAGNGSPVELFAQDSQGNRYHFAVPRSSLPAPLAAVAAAPAGGGSQHAPPLVLPAMRRALSGSRTDGSLPPRAPHGAHVAMMQRQRLSGFLERSMSVDAPLSMAPPGLSSAQCCPTSMCCPVSSAAPTSQQQQSMRGAARRHLSAGLPALEMSERNSGPLVANAPKRNSGSLLGNGKDSSEDTGAYSNVGEHSSAMRRRASAGRVRGVQVGMANDALGSGAFTHVQPHDGVGGSLQIQPLDTQDHGAAAAAAMAAEAAAAAAQGGHTGAGPPLAKRPCVPDARGSDRRPAPWGLHVPQFGGKALPEGLADSGASAVALQEQVADVHALAARWLRGEGIQAALSPPACGNPPMQDGSPA